MPEKSQPLGPARTDKRALRAVAAQFFVNGALFASVIPRLPEIRDQVGISIARVGLLLSVAGLFGLLGSAVVGPAVARLGTRTVMLVAGTLVALSLSVVGLAQTPLVLVAGLVVMFTFDVFVDVAMNMQGSWLSARRHTPVMNRLHGLWSLGAVAGGLSSSLVAGAGVSLRAHLTIAGTVLLAAVALVGRGLLRVDEHTAPVAPHRNDSRPARSTPRLLLFAIAGFTAVAVEATPSDWAAFRLTDDFAATAGFAAMGYVAVTAGMAAGRFAGDWASERLGYVRLMRAAAGLAGVGLAAASLFDNRYLSLVGFLAAGVGSATMLPNLYDQAAKRPGRPGAGLGALTAGIRMASLVLPFVVGTLAATTLSVGSAVAIVTVPGVVGFAVVAQLIWTHRSNRPRPGTR